MSSDNKSTYLKALAAALAFDDWDGDTSLYGDINDEDMSSYLRDTYGMSDDDIDSGYAKFTATDSDGNGTIDTVSIDKDGNGTIEKSSIIDDNFKAETPEEIDIRKELGVGGKFKTETPEEKYMLDSTGSKPDEDNSNEQWDDVVNTLSDRKM